MTAHWPLQDAKNKLSEVVRAARGGPQIITVRGKEEAVLLSRADYERVKATLEKSSNRDFVDMLLSIPQGGSDDEEIFERIKGKGRDIDF